MRLLALRRAALTSVLTLAATALVAVASPPAFAQATRTWVSGVGDDANPCSRTAPCKTFAGAISKTAAGGVISALDPAGFGAVTITKSITIDGTGTQASILAAGVNGVIVNGAGIDVTLRNINIDGNSPTTGCGVSPVAGVIVHQASSLRLDHVSISGMHRGISLPLTSANPDIFVDVSLNSVDVSNNCLAGVFAEPTAGRQARVVLSDSHISTSNQALVVGAGAEAWVADSSLSLNNIALTPIGGAAIHDMCGNTLVGNATASSFTDTAPACTVVVPTPTTTPVTPTPTPTPTPATVTYCVVPKLSGLTQNKAKAALTKAGCALGKTTKKAAPKAKHGLVLAQTIPAKVSVKLGTKVGVKLGR